MDEDEIERVARAICTNQGLDPDETVSHGYGADFTTGEWAERGSNCVPASGHYSPRWRLYRAKATEAIAIHRALRGEE